MESVRERPKSAWRGQMCKIPQRLKLQDIERTAVFGALSHHCPKLLLSLTLTTAKEWEKRGYCFIRVILFPLYYTALLPPKLHFGNNNILYHSPQIMINLICILWIFCRYGNTLFSLFFLILKCLRIEIHESTSIETKPWQHYDVACVFPEALFRPHQG